jgi:hypothetical protein
MPSAARILLLLSAPLFTALSSGGDAPANNSRVSDARKCAAPVSTLPQYYVNGRASDQSALKDIPEVEIVDVSVLCINPVDQTVIKPGVNTPGMPTIAIWTARGPSVQLEPLLKRINDAQRAHHALHGAYATTLGVLAIDSISADLTVTLDATPTRWRADAAVSRPTSPRCTVFDGTLDVPLPGAKGVVRCFGPA